MEKGPNIRIVGGASNEKKEQVKKELDDALFHHTESFSSKDIEMLAKSERLKSEREVALIDFANKETSKLMTEFGLEPYDVPTENYHIISADLYKTYFSKGSTATTSRTNQGVVFNAECFKDNPLHFGVLAFHETLHMKAHLSMQVEEDKFRKTPYRSGVTVKSSQKNSYNGKFHEHFVGLHEAIVGETEKRFLPKLLESPALIKEKEWLVSDEGKELKRKFAKEKNIPEEDIIWVGDKGENDMERVGYVEQRKVLNYLYDEIQKQFSDTYKDVDDIHREFLKANFTGQLLTIARLVEKTFGEGSFRLLGDMTEDRKSGVSTLEALRKAKNRKERGEKFSS